MSEEVRWLSVEDVAPPIGVDILILIWAGGIPNGKRTRCIARLGEDGVWSDEDGGPGIHTPTHWYPIPGETD